MAKGRVEMIEIPAKSIVIRTKNQNWFGTDYTMNIYRGCCHGCIYCDSRSECYHIENFDQVQVKKNALSIIQHDLKRKVKTGVVATGAMSDPYNPWEMKLQLTRHALELVDAFGFGAAIATKSAGIVRDIDILQQIGEHSPVICKITITTSDDKLCRKLEPDVSLSSERLDAISKLSNAGIFVGVLMMPVLPFLEDEEQNVISIVELAYEAGARFVYPAFGVTLRQNQREWYLTKLQQLFPDKNLRQQYENQFGYRYRCASPKAKELWKVFQKSCHERGILYRMPDIIRAYKMGYKGNQLSLF